MPEGLLDTLSPFLDHHSNVDGVDYRKSIFLFLSLVLCGGGGGGGGDDGDSGVECQVGCVKM